MFLCLGFYKVLSVISYTSVPDVFCFCATHPFPLCHSNLSTLPVTDKSPTPPLPATHSYPSPLSSSLIPPPRCLHSIKPQTPPIKLYNHATHC